MNLPEHAHALPGVAHVLLYTVCAINSILFSQQGMAMCTCTEDHMCMLISTAQYAAM